MIVTKTHRTATGKHNIKVKPLWEGFTNGGHKITVIYCCLKEDGGPSYLYCLLGELDEQSVVRVYNEVLRYNLDGTPQDHSLTPLNKREKEKLSIDFFPQDFLEDLERQEALERKAFNELESLFNEAVFLVNTFTGTRTETYVIYENSGVKDATRYLISPWTNGDLLWTDNVSEAYKFSSGDSADSAASKFECSYTVLPTSFILKEIAKKLKFK